MQNEKERKPLVLSEQQKKRLAEIARDEADEEPMIPPEEMARMIAERRAKKAAGTL